MSVVDLSGLGLGLGLRLGLGRGLEFGVELGANTKLGLGAEENGGGGRGVLEP